MIIIRFRGKYIILDYFQLGFAAYITTLGIMWFIEWRRNRKGPSSKFLKTISIRGGDFFLRRFLQIKLRKGTIYEVTSPSIIRYIRELTKSGDYQKILYIDLELLAYAIRTQNRPRISEITTRGFITIIKPAKIMGSIVIGTTGAIITKVLCSTSFILGSICLTMTLYTLPDPFYNYDMLTELPVNQDNIHYVLKEPTVGKILICIDEDIPEVQSYRNKGEIVSERKARKDDSVTMKHEPIKKYKFNRRIYSLRDLPEITLTDYDESVADAEFVRKSVGEDRIRIRMDTPNPDFE